MSQVLGRRALNRALLARQHLLRRSDEPVAAMVEHLVGLQAQAVMPPYIGLLARLERFDPRELGRMLTEREVVRLGLMRSTIHMVTVGDALLLRPLMQAVPERSHNGTDGRRMGGADFDELRAAVRELLSDEPLTARELGRRLLARGIGDDIEAIASATRYVPLVQVPPRGVWGAGGQARYATLEAWTGHEVDSDPSIDAVARRYLGAFGPASIMDMQNWSGLTKLKVVFERLRAGLVIFRDEHGKELFDLPGAPRPEPTTPAPPRFLGQFDNVLLGHADRRRIVPEDFPFDTASAQGRYVNGLLVDGMLRAIWWIERERDHRATLTIHPHRELSPAEREEVAESAEGVLELVAADAAIREVRFKAARA